MKELAKKQRQIPALRKILAWLLCLFGAVLLASLTMLAASDMAWRKIQWRRNVKAVEEQMNVLESSLSEMNMSLADLLSNSEEAQILRQETDIQRCNTAARRLSNKMAVQNRGRTLQYNFFFYALNSGTESFCYDGFSDYSDCMELRRMIKEKLRTDGQVKTGFVWIPVAVEQRVYLLQCYQLDNVVAAGWLLCSQAFSFLSNQEDYVMEDLEGRRLAIGGDVANGAGWGKLVKEFTMRYGALTLTIIDSPSEYLGTQMVTLCFLGVILLVVAAFSIYTLNYFQRYIQRPFEQLQGHVNNYVQERKTAKRRGFAELDQAMEAFDSLVEQLNQLKIEQYEEKITLARTQLDFFQLQIKPHFFVNTFSVLHGMAQKKDYERIQKFCLKLSDYVRYLFRDGLSTVPLEDELKAVKDYLDIQNIRYRAQSTLGREIPLELLSVNIPPLLLLTFVENAVKHSADDLSMLVVFIQAQPLRQGEFVKLTVSGNRSAFSPDDLVALNDPGHHLSNGDGEHVGVDNVRKRLSLMYGEEFQMSFSNRDANSVVEIVIPNRPNLHP